MVVEFRDDIVFLKGFLDEDINSKELLDSLLAAEKEVTTKYLKVNFSDVQLANSVGILHWLKSIESLKTPLCYSQAPKWLVSQLNMVPQFMHNNAVVESFDVPFYCEDNDDEIIQQFITGQDIEIKGESFSVEDFPTIEKDGSSYNIDVLPKNYFRFITENVDVFKEYFKDI